MSLRSHKWIMEPYTAYEIRRELRVRESRHTVMLFDKKYQNIDTGDYDTDRLETINSYSLGDNVDDFKHNHMEYGYSSYHRASGGKYVGGGKKDNDTVNHIPRFVPKDNDFDEECMRDEVLKDREYKRASMAVTCKVMPNNWNRK